MPADTLVPVLELWVPCTPVGKGRPKVRSWGTRYADSVLAALDAVQWVARSRWKGAPIARPCRVDVVTLVQRPKRLRTTEPDEELLCDCRTRPDADNAAALVADALQKAGVLEDDAWADVCGWKRYAPWGAAQGYRVRVSVYEQGRSE